MFYALETIAAGVSVGLICGVVLGTCADWPIPVKVAVGVSLAAWAAFGLIRGARHVANR